MGKTYKDSNRDREFYPKKKKFDSKKYSDIKNVEKFKEKLKEDKTYDDGYENFEKFKRP